jgi:hypothetical protein
VLWCARASCFMFHIASVHVGALLDRNETFPSLKTQSGSVFMRKIKCENLLNHEKLFFGNSTKRPDMNCRCAWIRGKLTAHVCQVSRRPHAGARVHARILTCSNALVNCGNPAATSHCASHSPSKGTRRQRCSIIHRIARRTAITAFVMSRRAAKYTNHWT